MTVSGNIMGKLWTRRDPVGNKAAKLWTMVGEETTGIYMVCKGKRYINRQYRYTDQHINVTYLPVLDILRGSKCRVVYKTNEFKYSTYFESSLNLKISFHSLHQSNRSYPPSCSSYLSSPVSSRKVQDLKPCQAVQWLENIEHIMNQHNANHQQ